jgi:hypothetical protein
VSLAKKITIASALSLAGFHMLGCSTADTTAGGDATPRVDTDTGSGPHDPGAAGSDASTLDASGHLDGGAADASDGADSASPPPGRSGLAGFCDHYFECGGTRYATAQDCIDDAASYWGACHRPLLDAFGECMRTIRCAGWDPDAYNPASTACASQWRDLRNAPACH